MKNQKLLCKVERPHVCFVEACVERTSHAPGSKLDLLRYCGCWKLSVCVYNTLIRFYLDVARRDYLEHGDR